MVTFSVGIAPGEFSALGADFRQRGRMMDGYIRVSLADQLEYLEWAATGVVPAFR
jgi:hypothetical protein